jgi:MoaA/NifB/PqqE/SkfB family radical SAM enzyme
MPDCAPHLDVNSRDYLARVLKKACSDRLPVHGTFDLTHRCNFRCAHCYVGHVVGRPRAETAELSTDEAIDLLAAAADAGCLLLLLSGGEPLLREDFIEIYEAGKRLGLVITLFTNGSLITERHIAAFNEFPPHLVEVTVYGATEATYERVTGVKGAFERSRAGIELLLEQGIPVNLKTMILRDNLHEALAMEDWARDRGVHFRMDPLVTPRLDGDLGPLEERVDPETAVAIELTARDRRARMKDFIARQDTFGESAPLPPTRLYQCGAGLGSFYLDPLGQMQPCLMSQGIKYNAHTMGFGAAWKAVTAAVDKASWEGRGGCAGCADILLCGYCPGLFELEKTTPAKPPEYVCMLGRSRYKTIESNRPEVVDVTRT